MTFPPIAELLPHRPPMLLLDAVVAFDAESVECTVEIRESSTFFEPPGGVPAWVALEYCAQAIAAFAGLKARNQGGEPRASFPCKPRFFPRVTSCWSARIASSGRSASGASLATYCALVRWLRRRA